MAGSALEPAGRQSQPTRRAILLGAAAGALLAGAPALAQRRGAAKGGLDLKEIEVIDTHMHPVSRMLISQSYARQQSEFGGIWTPEGDYPGKAALQARNGAAAEELVWGAPRRTGYFNYIARAYGVPPTMEGFNSVTSKHIGSDAAFSRYIQSILDRENISHVVLQAAEPPPSPPATLIPANRYVWTTVIHDMPRLAWAQERGLTELDDLLSAISRTMEQAVANGARGFKNGSAYYRDLGLSRVSKKDAAAAFQYLRTHAPSSMGIRGEPSYAAAEGRAAVRQFEDYLFKHIYLEAGRLERPIIIHTAVALHPHLRGDFNDPSPLYSVFMDPDIQRAATTFVLIHGGYPFHKTVAAFISQFANVYTDISFFSKYPGPTEELYRTFIGLGPSYKIMHGSDANSVPEEIGYCAWNTRAVLAKVLEDYRSDYGWTAADVRAAAENILNRNARRVFRID